MDREKINKYYRELYQKNKGRTFYCEVCKTTLKIYSKFKHIRSYRHRANYYELNLNTKSIN
jgi:hypothetical protein